ncbi:MAG: hypothetical protein J5J00_00110, partial [Deltaproteobacteria bacterium]|nr:hypothetical protein [Deltaproteobacteria bacterium]
GQPPHAAQRMIRGNPIFDADIAEKGLLLSINAAHFDIRSNNDIAIITSPKSLLCMKTAVSQQPASA